MQLYFIRHGQSTNNALWDSTRSDTGRSDDPPLSDIGHQQAALLAAHLSALPGGPAGKPNVQNTHGFDLTHLYCSLMVRAVQTAHPVADALGLPVLAWRDLHEGGGIYLEDESGTPVGRPGAGRSYLQANFPRLGIPDDVTDEGWWNRPIESQDERQPRAQRLVDELLAKHGGTEDRVAVVSHGAFYIHVMRALFGLSWSDTQPAWWALNNTAITRVDITKDYLLLAYANRVVHLPAELIT